ncbi:hypothetical protein AB0H69_25975 [Streptomyces phaeochromogenes]|uniref:hypothetical protein n=1 Tax=Streptomyces phaeochromogenes TaxID=1923 RepID=UPI0033C610C5
MLITSKCCSASSFRAVAAARHARAAQEESLRQRFGSAALDAARTLLTELLDSLGGTAAVQRSEARPPR